MTCARQDRCKHGDGCFVASDYDVARCTAFKSKVQTNEEYLRSCNTEELAIFIANIWERGYVSGELDFDRNCDTKYWMEWLKEKHE